MLDRLLTLLAFVVGCCGVGSLYGVIRSMCQNDEEELSRMDESWSFDRPQPASTGAPTSTR